MKLTDFISDLNDFNKDYDVEINLISNNDEDTFNIDSVVEKIYGKVLINVDLGDLVLVDRHILEELEEAEYELREIKSHN